MLEPLNYISEPEHANIPDAPVEKKSPSKAPFRFSKGRSIALCVGLIIFLSILLISTAAPRHYPIDTVINVPSGETLSGIASTLHDGRAIRSEFVFKAFAALLGGTKGLMAGDYYLEKPESVMVLAWRFTHSSYKLKNLRITIPEGTNSMEIANIIAEDKRFAQFDPVEFEEKAADYEGYLFPDTYLFLPNIEAQDAIDAMMANYEKKIQTLEAEITAFKKPIADVIKMASIIEEEARTDETRRTIAGILWKRLAEGMPLQVDAAFAFVNGKKDSRYITLDDLQIDSPYNTYVKKGLPPTPISNPGIDAIRATVTPIKTKYYFYLSDTEGNMHYGITHEDHLINKEKYIPW